MAHYFEIFPPSYLDVLLCSLVPDIQGAAHSSQYHKILLLDLQRTPSSQIVWRNNKNRNGGEELSLIRW